jgi:NH3-dependent NAD+ synthetase
MSLDDRFTIDPKKVETRIVKFITETLNRRDIGGFIVLYRDCVEAFVNIRLAGLAVGYENIKIILTQERFSPSPKTPEEDMRNILKYLDINKDNIIQINLEEPLTAISKIFMEKRDLVPAAGLSDSIPVLNYNLSYYLLRGMATKEIDEKKFRPPRKKPSSTREKFIQKSISHYKSKIRLNMLLAFLLAESENKSFIGHTNKTEWLLGLFTKYGTYHAADFLPLADLYRTQVLQLAEYYGFDEYLKGKAQDCPTSYNFFFNLTYREVDRILIRLVANLTPQEVFNETKLPLKAIEKINFHYQASDYARSVPLIPKFG